MTPQAQTVEPRRFFDGGTDSTPPAAGLDPIYQLTRHITGRSEGFQLSRRIAYVRRSQHTQPSVTLLVPNDLATWRTDFASIPAYLSWLVPRSGDHLPAAIVHDALLEGQYSYLHHDDRYPPGTNGPDLPPMPRFPRDEADLIMKEAMGDLGTGVARRWLIWTAVTLATLAKRKSGDHWGWRLYYFLVLVATTLGIVALGFCATANVMEAAGVEVWPWIPTLPWMQSADWRALIVHGLAGAVTVPVLASVFWGRFWQAGVIGGIALAALLHVTVVVAILTAVYEGLEYLGRTARGEALFAALLAAALLAFAIVAAALSSLL